MLEAFPLSLKILIKDKKALALSFVPIIIGIFLFALVGSWVISTVIPYGQSLIQAHVAANLEGVATFFLGALAVALLLITISWTFVLIVGIIAGPFNEFLSEKVENNLTDLALPQSSGTKGDLLKRFIRLWIHEVKKFVVIIFLSGLALLLGLIPFMTPFSLAISGLLLAVNFLSYSWSRHEWGWDKIWPDIRKNFFIYLISGSLWGFLITVPIINLFSLPAGVSFYTVLWAKLNFPKK